MISLFLLVFGTLPYLHGCEGGWTERMISTFVSPLMKPITEATKTFQETIEELETRKRELEDTKKDMREKINQIPKNCSRTEKILQSFRSFDEWNFDSCVKFTDDVKLGSELGMEASDYVAQFWGLITEMARNILICTNGDYFNMMPCYNRNIMDLEDKIFQFKTDTVNLVHSLVEVTKNLRRDFDHCIGIPATLKENLKKELDRINC